MTSVTVHARASLACVYIKKYITCQQRGGVIVAERLERYAFGGRNRGAQNLGSRVKQLCKARIAGVDEVASGDAVHRFHIQLCCGRSHREGAVDGCAASRASQLVAGLQ